MLKPFRIEPDKNGNVFITLDKKKIGYSIKTSGGYERVVVDEAIELVFEISPAMLKEINEAVEQLRAADASPRVGSEN